MLYIKCALKWLRLIKSTYCFEKYPYEEVENALCSFLFPRKWHCSIFALDLTFFLQYYTIYHYCILAQFLAVENVLVCCHCVFVPNHLSFVPNNASFSTWFLLTTDHVRVINASIFSDMWRYVYFIIYQNLFIVHIKWVLWWENMYK